MQFGSLGLGVGSILFAGCSSFVHENIFIIVPNNFIKHSEYLLKYFYLLIDMTLVFHFLFLLTIKARATFLSILLDLYAF